MKKIIAIMAMLIFSTAGVPPFVGFTAKLAVIQSIIGIGYTWLAGVAVFFSVIGAYFYIRVVKVMYFDSPLDSTPIQAGYALRRVLSANGLAVLVLGLLPGALLDLCARVIG
jgi:NADH-quinone oxidoreductase subunit N